MEQEIRAFVNYVHSFYGPEDDQTPYPMGATKEQVRQATMIYLDSMSDNEKKEVEFDSIDREAVRDILIEELGLVWIDD